MTRAANRDRLAVGRTAMDRNRDLPPAANVKPRDRIRITSDVAGRSQRYDRATVRACARTQVNYIVGSPNCLLVMFNHQHRIAEIAQRR